MFNHLMTSALVLVTLTDAHMTLNTPKPYGAPSTSPLSTANYPCQLQGDPGTFYARTTATKMAVGEDQKLTFAGDASHNGGSCQISITSDLQPTTATHWQVIKSIIGGCPTTGNSGGSSEYSFKIPEGVAPGLYSFAWTWIAHSSGLPEFYMNCAPIEVTGGASKRSALNESLEISSLAKRDGLPDLFVANLAGINDCKSVGETDPIYPNPGDVVEKPPGNRKYQDIIGTNCCPEGQCKGGSSASSRASSSNNASESSAPASAALSAAVSSQATSSVAGGFDTGAYTAASVSSAPSVSIFSVPGFQPSSSVATSTKTSAPSGFLTSVTSVAPVSASVFRNNTSTAAVISSASSSFSSSSSAGGLSGACTAEGMFSCTGSFFQQCASGSWTALRPLAAGTICKSGLSMTLWRREEF